MTVDGKTVLSVVEQVDVQGTKASRSVLARIDTGASVSSIDAVLAEELGSGGKIREKAVRNAQGVYNRPVHIFTIMLKGKSIQGEFTIANRKNMKYPLLIGRNILIHDFVIVPGTNP